MPSSFEYKAYGSEVKDVDVKMGVVTGYFSSWKTDSGGDTIQPGSFTKTIREWGPESKRPRIKMLWMHDAFAPVGIPHVLKEDDRGLYFETKLVDTAIGRDTLKLYESGVISEHSIGFVVPAGKASYGKNSDGSTDYSRRTIKEIRLYEGSAVVWGMNADTPFTGMKSLLNPEEKTDKINDLSTRIARIEKALRHGDLSTAEIGEALELWSEQMNSVIEALSAPVEPVVTTPTEETLEPPKSEDDPAQVKLYELRDWLKSN